MRLAKAIHHDPESPTETQIKVPPAVPGGTYVVEDLGRFVNWITRVKHTESKVAEELADISMTDAEWEAQGGDPEPIDPPPPVPGGDDVGTRGGKPSDFETK